MEGFEFTIRASELKLAMTEPRSKAEMFSETTLTWLREKVSYDFFGIKKEIETSAMRKGIECENEGINLYNSVNFTDFKKNEESFKKGFFTGTPDIISDDNVIDIKTSWSFDTFPIFLTEAEKIVKNSGYDWQLQQYMMLTGKRKAEVAFCFVTTPEHLLTQYDDRRLHDADLIEESKRVTVVELEYSDEKEEKMHKRASLLEVEYFKLIEELKRK